MAHSFIGAGVVSRYVDGENGDDGWTGDITYPWRTVGHGVTTIASGSAPEDADQLIIKKTSNDSLYYRETAKVNIDWNSKEVLVTGANSSGVVDGTLVSLSGASLDASTPIWDITVSTADAWRIANLVFDGESVAQHGVEATAANNHMVTWMNCRFTNCTSDGMNTNSLTQYWNIINCRFDNNGAMGYNHNGSQYGMVYKCLFDNNASSGAQIGGVARVANCVSYNNQGYGLIMNSMNSVVCDCVFVENKLDGVQVPTTSTNSTSNWVGNVCSGNTGYGVEISDNSSESAWFNTVITDNVGGSLDDGSEAMQHTIMHNTNETGSVNFRDTANLDFTPTSTSSVIGSNWPSWMLIYGSTAGNSGMINWVNTDSSSTF
jgi:hypothetical protein